jgi:hypothetical protein
VIGGGTRGAYCVFRGVWCAYDANDSMRGATDGVQWISLDSINNPVPARFRNRFPVNTKTGGGGALFISGNSLSTRVRLL